MGRWLERISEKCILGVMFSITSANSERRVFGVDSLLVILDLLRGDIESKMVADEASDAANLDSSEFPL